MIMKNWKDITQYATAVAGFASGVALAFIQYFQTGDLSNGVLGYVAQVLVYAASIFGVTMYWNGKYREVLNNVDLRYNKIEKEIGNDRNGANLVSSQSK